MTKPGLVLLLLALIGRPGFAGVVFEFATTEHQNGTAPQTVTTEMQVENHQLRMRTGAGGAAQEILFRGDRRQMFIIDHGRESYMVVDREAMQAMGHQMQQAMSQIQDMLKNVPEEQRAVLEKMLLQQLSQAPTQRPKRPQSELRETGERAHTEGYAARKVEIWRDNRKLQELWVTDWNNLKGSADVKAVFEDIAVFFQDMQETVDHASGAAGGFGVPFGGDNPLEHLHKLGGFPVVTLSFMASGALAEESVLRSTHHRRLDPDAFEPPPTYRRHDRFGRP